MKRFQARRSGGRFTRNTLENTCGLHAGICDACHRFNAHGVNETAPDVCAHCGATLLVCAHGRNDPFPMPPFLPECGKPAVACDVERRWPVCAEHVATETP